MTGGFWWENYKSSFDEAERERKREAAEEAVCGRLHLQERVKWTPGQLTGDD